MSIRPLFKFSLSALGLAAALAAAPLSALAVPVQSAAGSYNLGTDVALGATAAPTSVCSGSGVDALEFTSAGANSIGIHSYSCGLTQYAFGTRSSGQNSYYVDGSASVIGQVTLSAGSGFSFSISPGQVGAFGSTAFTAGEYQESSLSIQLAIDNVVYIDQVFHAMVGVGGAQTFSNVSSGSITALSNFNSGAGYVSYDLLGGDFNIGLADGTYEVSYVMTSLARGNIISTTSCTGIGAGRGLDAQHAGGGIAASAVIGIDDGSFPSHCGAGAQSGDPFPALAQPLPEPGSIGLVGLAGAMLVLAPVIRRRRPGQRG